MDTDPQKDLACLPHDLAVDLEAEKRDTEEDQLSPDQVAALTGISDIVGDAAQTPVHAGREQENLDTKMASLNLANSKPFKPQNVQPFYLDPHKPNNSLFQRGLSFDSDKSDSYSNNATQSKYSDVGISNASSVNDNLSIYDQSDPLMNEVQDQVKMYGYIFQSPDSQGILHHRGGMRASSFDKASLPIQPQFVPKQQQQVQYQYSHYNYDDLDNTSAHSKGSNFSEGDLQYQTPTHNQYSYQRPPYFNYQPMGAFTPNIQFSANIHDSYISNDINITGTDVQLGKTASPAKRNSDLRAQQEQEFKTPPPYRNEGGQMYQPSSAPHHYPNYHAPHNIWQGPVSNQQQMMDPNSYIYSMGGQSHQGYDFIGMQAPPMTGRGFEIYNNHGNMPQYNPRQQPMMIINPQGQPQNIMSFQQQKMPQNLRTTKQPNSQERENTGHLMPGPGYPRTVENTPSHGAGSDQLSLSSQGSYSGLVMDQNEHYLYQIIKQYEETQNPQQKFDILKGHVVKLAFTQTGSRFLQKQLTKANSNIVTFLIQEIGSSLPELMIDNYGNYFCQKLLQSCSSEQRHQTLKQIQDKFLMICCNKKGTHTIQTMFDLISLPAEEVQIKECLRGNVQQLAKDQQGTHVIQKVITSFPESKWDFIFDEIFDCFIDLANHNHGLCVIKKFVVQLKTTENRKKLMEKIASSMIELVQNPYGNYAIAEILMNWKVDECEIIFQQVQTKVCQLSNQKFSSNIIERCIETAPVQYKQAIIQEIYTSDHLQALIRNSYGNYVVQKALKIATGTDRQMAIDAIASNVPNIPDRKIRLKWEKIIEEAKLE